MKKLVFLLASLAVATLVSGCGSKGSSAGAPADFRVVAGDASVIVTWTAEPGVEYWIFYGPGESISTTNWSTTGGAVIARATSPRVVTGLINGNTYSFTINARRDGGPGGEGAPTQIAVPTLAGANWAVGAALGSRNLAGIAAGQVATGFANVAVGAGGAIFASIDSAATTTPTNPAAPTDLNAVWYSVLGFVAVGANGTIIHSIDATTWEAQTSGTTAALRGGTSVGVGGFIAVGDAGTLLSSPDARTWVPLTSGTTSRLNAVIFGNGRYVAVGANGTIVTTNDNITWQAVTSGTANDLRGVAYASLATTTAEGTTRTDQYVAVGAAGTVLTSSDGLAWTVQPAFSAFDITAVVYGGQFVAVGKSGSIFTSVDGIAWQTRASGTTRDLAALVRTLSGYTAVGESGTNVSSF